MGLGGIMERLLPTDSVSILRQAANRSLFAEVLSGGQLVREVVVDASGYLKVEAVNWNEYWSGSLAKAPDKVRSQLEFLRVARQTYCQSGYDFRLAISYSFRYFDLLRVALAEKLDQRLLAALASFEVFPIRRFHSSGAEAAGVITARHPAYLLAKLRKPNAPDDPKYLPLVCLQSSNTPHLPGSLYYHYRQLKFDARHNASVLVYPAVDIERRRDSFGCLDVFFSILRSKPDPRGRQRAAAIADCAVGPFLMQHSNPSGGVRSGEISIADLGGGTGILLSHLCKRLLTRFPDALRGRAFAWSLVDLSIRNPARHTTGRLLRPNLSMVEYVQADYKSWVTQEHAKSGPSQWDVALMCRVLNNMSCFSVEVTDDRREIAELSGETISRVAATFQPAYCLSEGVRAPDFLIASNAKANLRNGRSFQQLSLTDYFQTLRRVCHGNDSARSGDRVFFPLRRLNQDALRLDDGRCLFEQLAAIADLVVIEDVDMDADRLYDYLDLNNPKDLAASDATDRRRMQLSNLLCFSRREHADLLPGGRLW